ncbi:MAG: ribbon-helix-helix protein, CopG family [Thermoanaerobaculia bacterium]
MATTKATFTLDPEALRSLERTAERLKKSKSEIVREAIVEYGERVGRLSERERLRMLRIFDEMVPTIPQRPQEEVEAELAEIRAERRSGGRRTPVE